MVLRMVKYNDSFPFSFKCFCYVSSQIHGGILEVELPFGISIKHYIVSQNEALHFRKMEKNAALNSVWSCVRMLHLLVF